MAKENRVDPELRIRGEAIRALRRAKGVTQEGAASRASPTMTSQYWGMHEQGKVEGLYRPATQRKLLDAIGATVEEFEDTLLKLQIQGDQGEPHSRLAAIAGGLGDQPAPSLGRGSSAPKQAIFQLSEGQVAITYPGNLSPKGFQELAAYLTVFLRTAGQDAATLAN